MKDFSVVERSYPRKSVEFRQKYPRKSVMVVGFYPRKSVVTYFNANYFFFINLSYNK